QRVEFPWQYFQINTGLTHSGNVNFTSDQKGRLTRIRHTRVSTDYAYNARDFLVGLKNYAPFDGNVTLSEFGSVSRPTEYIAYDALGLPHTVPFLLKVSNANNSSGTITYRYDPQFRLS